MDFDPTEPFDCARVDFANFHITNFGCVEESKIEYTRFPFHGDIIADGEFYKEGCWTLRGEFNSGLDWERRTFRLRNVYDSKKEVAHPKKCKIERSPLEIWGANQLLLASICDSHKGAMRGDVFSCGAMTMIYLLELDAPIHEDIAFLMSMYVGEKFS